MSFFTWAELLLASNPQFVQGVTGQNLTDTITVTLPSAPTTGNTLLAAVSFQETVAGGATANLPTGFVQVGSTLNFDGSVSYNYLSIFTFTVPSSPASSYTFSYTSGTGATIGGIDVQLSEWSGVYASSPIDVFTTATGSSTTPSVPSVTTTRKNDTLITVSAFDGRSATTAITYTAPSGYTSFLGDSASTTAPIAAGNADIAFDTPGATTATNATLSATGPWGTFVLALASVAGSTVVSLSATGQSNAYGTATLSNIVNLSATGESTGYGTADLSNIVNLSASGQSSASGTASISTPTTLTSTGQSTGYGTASLEVIVNLSATGQSEGYGTASLSITSTLSATGQSNAYGTASIETPTYLSATGSSEGYGTASITTLADLSSTGSSEGYGTATLSTPTFMSATGQSEAYGTASLASGIVYLSATGESDGYGTAILGAITYSGDWVATLSERPFTATISDRPFTATLTMKGR